MSFSFNFGTDRVEFGFVRILVDEESEPLNSFLRLVGILEKDGNTKQSRVVGRLQGEQTLVVSLGILVVAPLLKNISTIKEGIDVAGIDVEDVGIVDDSLIVVAQQKQKFGTLL